MFYVVLRAPRPDAPYWAGRRWLAAIDALVWPIAWVWAVRAMPVSTGIVGPVVIALCVLAAVGRLHTAVCENHRYWFTTWKWGRVAMAVWLMGVVIKLTLAT